MGCVQAKGGGARRGLKKCCCDYQDSDSSAAAGDGGGADPKDGTDPSYRRLRHVLAGASLGTDAVPSAGLCLQFSSLTQRGLYPDSPDRANQDSFCIETAFQSDPNMHLFAVFDGHGVFGTQCAQFARDKLVELLAADPRFRDDPVAAFHDAFPAANAALHDSDVDDSMSGTTAIAALVKGDALVVANVGDSRAVAGVWDGDAVVAEDLSSDQKPFRRDEYERVRQCGARVLSVDQVEGNKDPDIQSWAEDDSDDGDPPRLWVQNGMYPGTAFTRSIGDATAESIGVIALPEVKTVRITSNHLFFVVASDGVFEFLSSQAVVDMVYKYEDPRDACAAVAAESYKLWLEHENRTDDITMIIVYIKDLPKSDDMLTEETIQGGKDALIALGKLKAGTYTMSNSEGHQQKEDSGNMLLHSPVGDLPMERSLACVAPSPLDYVDGDANDPDR